MAPPSSPSWKEIQVDLDSPSSSIEKLYRALFCVRKGAPSEEIAIATLRNSFANHSSVLFRHECCYLLGQAGADTGALDLKRESFEALLGVLKDVKEDEVTRHEAAEGIAAVFNNNMALENPVFSEGISLQDYLKNVLDATRKEVGRQDSITRAEDAIDSSAKPQAARNQLLIDLLNLFTPVTAAGLDASPLGQTCFLAIEGLKRDTARVCACQYSSYDPAIGVVGATDVDILQYATQLEGDGMSHFDAVSFFPRYVAMFTLRNLGAASALACALSRDQTSPVLRHEIAFILGQMDLEAPEKADELDAVLQALTDNLADSKEHSMVRHESAIALGSLGGEKAKAALQQYSKDTEKMVAESCLVGLSTAEYWEA